MDEYLTRPVGVRLDRLRRTPAEIASLLEGRDRAALARRPDAHSCHPLDGDRWADDRQDARQDPAGALEAFGRRRGEVVAVLDALSLRQGQRGGIHQARGRMAVGEWVARLAAHDDNHLAQLRRALDGRP